MVNLTSFKLAHTSPGEVSAAHLLDFFESAPRLRQVELHASAPTSGAQNGRLVTGLPRVDVRPQGRSFTLLTRPSVDPSWRVVDNTSRFVRPLPQVS